MKFYVVKIGTRTRKGINDLVEKHIQSTEMAYSVQKHFEKRYSGFEVKVKEFEKLEKHEIETVDDLPF